MGPVTLALVVLACHGAALLWLWRRHGPLLLGLWREPVLATPVLCIESDDWGAPGPEQVQGLREIAECLRRHCDSEGRPAVMTLGLVLAAPRPGMPPDSWSDTNGQVTVGDPDYEALRWVLEEAGDCLVPHLHGWMHCWPPAVARAAERDEDLGRAAGRVALEGYQVLPAALQTRWADCAELPCTPVRGETARREAEREARHFFAWVPGARPAVVPPTFVWNEDVEQGWAAAGIRLLVTPGWRQEGRDAAGRPQPVGPRLFNGQRLSSGLRVVVRDLFFEPSLGHAPEAVFEAVRQYWRLGRPALLETHRFNFEDAGRAQSLAALERLLARAVQVPGVVFLEPLRLIERLDAATGCLTGRARLRVYVRRVWHEWTLRRPLVLTGGVLWLGLAWLASVGSEAPES